MILFDVQDQRKIGDGVAIDVSEEKLYAIAEQVGIPQDSAISIKLRIRDVKDGRPTAQVEVVGEPGKGSYRIVLRLLPKASLSDKAKYRINASLVHEMRHVAQFEAFGAVVIAMNQTQYEEEAIEYGRLAKPSEKGSALWAIGEPSDG